MPIRSINGDEEAAALVAGGELAPSSRRPTAGSSKPVILVRKPTSAAASGYCDDANSSDGLPPSVGELAVRLVAAWSLPRMTLVPIREEDDRHQLPSTHREEDGGSGLKS